MDKRIRCRGKAMTVLVLAGGRGRRMRADKAGLDVGGRTLLQHVLAQVEPCYDEVLISLTPGQPLPPRPGVRTSHPRRLASPPGAAAPRARVVLDETPGLGPIGGILAGLKAARNDACMVVACDIPDIDLPLAQALARQSSRSEITVPVGPSGLYEPLFAIYRRSVIPRIEALVAAGERSLLPLFDRCRTAMVRFDDAGRIRNLNTRKDYEAYLRSIEERNGPKPATERGRSKKSRLHGTP